MKKVTLLITMLHFMSIIVGYSQSKTDCNTIFVCIENKDYAALFENSFVKDTLFICKENTTNTATDQYTGKYFIGEFATIELMQPSKSNKFGDHLHDIGIEFKTRKRGDLVLLKNQTKPNLFKVEGVTLKDENKDYLWYNTLMYKNTPSNLEISMLEYSHEYLEMLGFTKDEIAKEITPDFFNKVVYDGKKYPRMFQSIKSIVVEVNKDTEAYLKKTAKAFHYKITDKAIFCNDFTIYYQMKKNFKKTLLKSIEINLKESNPDKKISISPNINIHISKNIGRINFTN